MNVIRERSGQVGLGKSKWIGEEGRANGGELRCDLRLRLASGLRDGGMEIGKE